MATAKIKTKIESVTLELSYKEAVVLKALIGYCAGGTGLGKLALEDIFNVLKKIGVPSYVSKPLWLGDKDLILRDAAPSDFKDPNGEPFF